MNGHPTVTYGTQVLLDCGTTKTRGRLDGNESFCSSTPARTRSIVYLAIVDRTNKSKQSIAPKHRCLPTPPSEDYVILFGRTPDLTSTITAPVIIGEDTKARPKRRRKDQP